MGSHGHLHEGAGLVPAGEFLTRRYLRLALAVADLGVAMGPRNRRRLTTSGIVSSVIAALVAGGLLLARSAGLSTRSSPVSPSARSFVYGMTPQQVRGLAGRPTATRGTCWQYRVEVGMVGSASLAGVAGGPTADSVRLCFFAGVFSSALIHRYIPSRHRSMWLPWAAVGPRPSSG